MSRKRDLAIGDQTLGFNFRNMGANPQGFINDFSRRFNDHEEEIRDLVPQPKAVTGSKGNKIKATYAIPVEEYEAFFEAYIAALTNAFVEHTVENKELIKMLDELYIASVKAYRGELSQ